MKLKVGDYVRFNRGGIKVAKLLENINNSDYWETNIHQIILASDIIESSSKIIDLIQAGDYVNGYEVMEPKYHYMGNNFIDFDREIDAGSGYGYQLLEKDIKSIVTKEQFEQMEYRIGEDE